MKKYARERALWKGAERNQWLVARTAYQCQSRPERLMLAHEIETSEDTIDNLAYAYKLFGMLVLDKGCLHSEPIRNLRRKYPYTRWMTVCKMWTHHEFQLDEAIDWLENFDGGNDAMAAEIENKYGVPEWERRAYKLYREAGKLSSDIGAPQRLQRAAKYYMKVFDAEFKDVK